MYVTELDSFVQKFQQLWKAGVNAHLDVNTHAGKAWVTFEYNLVKSLLALHTIQFIVLIIIGSKKVLLANAAVTGVQLPATVKLKKHPRKLIMTK